jgi:hypothetical protein
MDLATTLETYTTTVVKSTTGVTLAKDIKIAYAFGPGATVNPNKPPFFRDIKIYGSVKKSLPAMC